ncbi:nucleotidyl transferase AbiEii/AbiGii toxin family protein [Muricauda ruestringensis]|uniref:Nucleotidyl transferase AbiEii/AbiGii toxin family protein n=1 Tax=Flagellimonas aurea TaxID=2915619 RepID=A0ABS3G869_9FLAO|nr:nucleotidyl transferase AbiEii/AbiGii toxin family protein [Allomuricauda aurea]MBO0355610.1 nucleotidyl transferase AbiEii/AbiGii toxin family protein [Allomuricauda aurea]
MIPRPYIVEWQEHAPWKSFDQIEQDLIISQTLVAIFSDDFLKENMTFRGCTALHKLYLNPAPRYSEDIDLVHIKRGPTKPIMRRLGEVIYFFEESRRTEVRGHGAKALYRFNSAEYGNTRRRLKLEIKCKEHFKVLDWIVFSFEIKNRWFSGKAQIRTYNLNELVGTKLRALYQRSKDWNLFDLDYSLLHISLDNKSIVQCFKEYMAFSVGKPLSQKEFLRNIEEKENDSSITGDMDGNAGHSIPPSLG